MASEQYEPLLRLGPFTGLDFSSVGTEVQPGMGVLSSNANPITVKGALMQERGRVAMRDFSDVLFNVTQIVPLVMNEDAPQYLLLGITAGGFLYSGIRYNPANGNVTNLGIVEPFDQAVQFQQVLYMNNGLRLFLSNTGGEFDQFYDWQYVPPPVIPTNLSGFVQPGGLDAGEYFYIYTRTTTMPDGSVSETSVNLTQFANPPHFTLGSDNMGIELSFPNPSLLSGTNPDGTTFTTNIYRQSTNQPGYLFLANVTSATVPYFDTTPDSGIVGNRQLEVHRDPPPTIGQQNRGALAIHKNRVWVFVTVQDSDTENLAETQLWYSNFDRAWEFDNTSQVLLLQSDVTSGLIGTSPNYDDLYGNLPKALASVGTVLMAYKKRETWAVFGDDVTTFVQRYLFPIGCVSRYSVTPALGGVFWLSEHGVYYINSLQPQYTNDNIRDALRPIPGSIGVPPLHQKQAVGAFSNQTYYLCFPQDGFTLSYFTITGQWLSKLPYTCFGQPDVSMVGGALAFVPANPNRYTDASGTPTGDAFNEVIAARADAPTKVDWWFAATNGDLGLATSFSWTGPLTHCGKPSFEKQFRYVTLQVPPGTLGSAVVTLTLDGVPYTWTIADLSTTTRHIRSIGRDGGLGRAFLAQLEIQVAGVQGQQTPQIWDVIAWGQVPPDRNLVMRV